MLMRFENVDGVTAVGVRIPCLPLSGCSLMVKPLPSKQQLRVRFSLPVRNTRSEASELLHLPYMRKRKTLPQLVLWYTKGVPKVRR